jgi:serine protease Do
VLSPKNSPLGQLLDKYVFLRIVRLDNVDIGLFEYDRNNAIYFFAMNADEQIYLRYGGRDSQSADTYLDVDSLQIALRQGLDLHARYNKGELAKTQRPKAMSGRDIPLLVKRTYASGNCVECHLIGDFQNLEREAKGTLDKVTHLYRSPDIKTIGLHLDVPKGLVLKETKTAAASAGLQPGDRLTHLNGAAIWTFGDLQHAYDKVNRKATEMKLTADRGGQAVDATIALPARWWVTDLRFRQSSVDPRLYFEDRPLTPEARTKLGLKPNGFASEVKHVPDFARVMKVHQLKVGDVIYAIDGVETDDIAHTAELYLKVKKNVGDTVKLSVLRGGQKLEMSLTSTRMSFRK